MGLQDPKKLLVWHRAQRLCTDLDPVVRRIAERKPGLADQIDRCANSICANIAEACGRETQADKRRIITVSIGETTELESHLIRALNANLIGSEELTRLNVEVTGTRKMLYGLRKAMT